MVQAADELDLGSLALASGEGRRLDLAVHIEPLQLGGERYRARPEPTLVRLDISRMIGAGHALRLSFQATLVGPCMRCLQEAAPLISVQAREVHVPGGDEQMRSPYVRGQVLDLRAWARDAFALAVPVRVLCRQECLGLCPVCAADLNVAGPEHVHPSEPDPRWAKLRELRLD
jgi:uncharacterized protein